MLLNSDTKIFLKKTQNSIVVLLGKWVCKNLQIQLVIFEEKKFVTLKPKNHQVVSKEKTLEENRHTSISAQQSSLCSRTRAPSPRWPPWSPPRSPNGLRSCRRLGSLSERRCPNFPAPTSAPTPTHALYPACFHQGLHLGQWNAGCCWRECQGAAGDRLVCWRGLQGADILLLLLP